MGMEGFHGSIPEWMHWRSNTLVLPTYEIASRNYQHYRIPRPPAPEESATAGLICWGTVGDMPTAEPAPTVTFTIKEELTETRRQSQLVRIQNPDDASQYIMVYRPMTVHFDKKTLNTKPGSNTGAETPPGMAGYENTDQFTTDSGEIKTKVRVHYIAGHGETVTAIPSL